jgi:hypothetical protein
VFQLIQSTPRCIPATHFGPKRAGDRKPGSRVTFWSKPNRRQETGHQGQHLANNWTAQACQYRIQLPDSLSTGPTGQPVNGNNQTACQLDQTDSPSATIIGQPRLPTTINWTAPACHLWTAPACQATHQLDITNLPVFGQHQPVNHLARTAQPACHHPLDSTSLSAGQEQTCQHHSAVQHQPVSTY